MYDKGDILDRKEVVRISEDEVLEWRLIATGEGESSIWKPFRVFRNNFGDLETENPAWMPLPGSQYTFLECPIFEALYEGNRGPGKTLTLLMDFAKDVGKGYGKSWRGVLFRREYKDLDDVVRKIEEFFPKIFPGFRFLRSKSDYSAVWPDGETLLLRHLAKEEDYDSYHGHEYPWIGFEELTQWENDTLFNQMMSCCRPTAPGVPCRMRSSTNPYGPGHCLPYGEVLTNNGWKDIKEMAQGDVVLTMGQDGISHYREISDTVREKYCGDMILREGRGIHMAFTSNHRLPQKTKDGFNIKPFTELPGQADIVRTCRRWGGDDETLDLFNSLIEKGGVLDSAESGVYYTSSSQLADDVSELATKLGKKVYTSSRQGCYTVNFSKGGNTQLNTDDVDRSHFEGYVFCITVPETEVFFVRQEGCVWLSGNTWVKKRYKLPDHRGKVINIPGEVERVALHGSLFENFLLLHSAPNYVSQIKQAAKNPAQAKAWVLGDWNVTSGGMVDDIWDDRVHILPAFNSNLIPRGWTITRSYDHGQSSPFSVGWWLESNGEPVTLPNGRVIGRVRGDLILYAEWYGAKEGENSSYQGLSMPSSKIAEGILDREDDMGIRGRVQDGPADTEIYTKDSRGTAKSPADDMANEGVTWERADKSRGSRKRGWEMLRKLLMNAKPNRDGTRDKAGLFVCDCCRYWLELIPPMPRDKKDPDEIPPNYEDHGADMTRYRITWEIPALWRVGF